MPNIEIYNRRFFERYADKLLSLHDESYKFAGILCTSKEAHAVFPSMLCLEFMDTEEISEISFNYQQADLLCNYIESNLNVDTIYVCCDSGENRSMAVAAVLYKVLGKDEDLIWNNPYCKPSALVYKLLGEAYGFEILDSETENKIKQNELALKCAIDRGNKGLQLNRHWYEVGLNSNCDDTIKKLYFNIINNLSEDEMDSINCGIINNEFSPKMEIILNVFEHSDFVRAIYESKNNILEITKELL